MWLTKGIVPMLGAMRMSFESSEGFFCDQTVTVLPSSMKSHCFCSLSRSKNLRAKIVPSTLRKPTLPSEVMWLPSIFEKSERSRRQRLFVPEKVQVPSVGFAILKALISGAGPSP